MLLQSATTWSFFVRPTRRIHLDTALALVDQVHLSLGRYSDSDSRSGWISGLDGQEGALHPTRGGLRIGKKMMERKADELFDEHLEWERDGQYFHYLTKWMHALDRVARVTEEPRYNRWALELAKKAHAGFTYTAPDGKKRMYWKMSIDLSYPLVASMGRHDPLDGLITCMQLQTTALRRLPKHRRISISMRRSRISGLCVKGHDGPPMMPWGSVAFSLTHLDWCN